MIVHDTPPSLAASGCRYHYSAQFDDFVHTCLRKSPEKRPSAAEMLQHPFLRKAHTPAHLQRYLFRRTQLDKRPRDSDACRYSEQHRIFNSALGAPVSSKHIECFRFHVSSPWQRLSAQTWTHGHLQPRDPRMPYHHRRRRMTGLRRCYRIALIRRVSCGTMTMTWHTRTHAPQSHPRQISISLYCAVAPRVPKTLIRVRK